MGMYIIAIVVIGLLVASFCTMNPWLALGAFGLVVIYMLVTFEADRYKID